MTTTKNKYVKPEMTVIKIEPQLIICSSITYSRDKDEDGSNLEYWTDEFE